MKNYLRYLFIAMLALVCGGVNAQTSIDFTKCTPTLDTKVGYTLEAEGFTFTAQKEKGSTVPTKNSTYNDLRHYAKNTLTISGAKMTQIVFTMSDQGKKQWANLTASTGSVTVDKEAGTTTWAYAEGATSVTLTVGDKNDNGSNTTKTAGQFDINSAVFITEGSGTSKKSADLAFSETTINYEAGTTFAAPTFSKATTATISFTSDNEEVATINSEGIISLGGSEGKAIITAKSEENDAYYAGSATCTVYVYHMNIYKQATEVKSGKGYLLVAKRDGNTYYAMPVNSNGKNYGYANTIKLEEDASQITIKSSYNDEFVFTAEGTSGYSIKDSNDKYYIQKGTYTNFQFSDEPGTWTVEPQTDGTFKIEMNGYYVQFGDGTYTSFGVYNVAKDNTVMPYLYEIDDTATGISTITTDTAANAPAYNLAGQKVSSSYKGVVIKAGKKFVQK